MTETSEIAAAETAKPGVRRTVLIRHERRCVPVRGADQEQGAAAESDEAEVDGEGLVDSSDCGERRPTDRTGRVDRHHAGKPPVLTTRPALDHAE